VTDEDEQRRLGSSGVFKAIVEGARKVGRAITEAEPEAGPEAHRIGELIAQAFVAGRLGDVYALGATTMQRGGRERFEASWRDALTDRTPLTGFEVADAGAIEVHFVPGLEDVAQAKFVAFLAITFSSPDVALDDPRAFTVGAVLLDEDGEVRLGALHVR
jgi:hypothetical protein